MMKKPGNSIVVPLHFKKRRQFCSRHARAHGVDRLLDIIRDSYYPSLIRAIFAPLPFARLREMNEGAALAFSLTPHFDPAWRPLQYREHMPRRGKK